MVDDTNSRGEIDKFIFEEIDSVPHLEALLLIWTQRPKRWSIPEVARSLYVEQRIAAQILKELSNRRLLNSEGEDVYFCEPDAEQSRIFRDLATVYSKELVRISRLIHSKAPAAVREFARAFRFTKERD